MPPSTQEPLPERLIRLREMANLTQGEVAHEVGVDVRTIQRYEVGDTRVPLGRLRALAEVLGADVHYLMLAYDLEA